MNRGKICISVTGATANEMVESMIAAARRADMIELRLDTLPPNEVERFLFKFASIGLDVPVIATYRPIEQGGSRVISRDERIEFWKSRKHLFESIDIEHDIAGEVSLDGSRIVSKHDCAGTANVSADTAELLSHRSDIYKYAAKVDDAIHAVPIWQLLKRFSGSGKRIIPIAMGEAGKWTRILGPAYGAFMTFAALDSRNATAAGQIAADEMDEVFRVRSITPETAIYGIIAGDTSYSLSPYIHNAAFRETNIDRVFVPFQTADVGNFLELVVRRETRGIDLPFRGFSVTNPHKVAVISHLDELSDDARKIGAVNTIDVAGDRLIGHNTDAAGFISPLIKRFGDLDGSRSVVIGSGGAARACVHALRQRGAMVEIHARNQKAGTDLAEQFDAKFVPLESRGTVLDADIVVNATPVGTSGKNENTSPIAREQLAGVRLVYDLTYDPSETALIADARAAGCETIGGLEMLIGQAAEQFRIWTGKPAPLAIMEQAARHRLANRRPN